MQYQGPEFRIILINLRSSGSFTRIESKMFILIFTCCNMREKIMRDQVNLSTDSVTFSAGK